MTRSEHPLYRCDNARRYLLDWLVARQRLVPGYSVRKWARELDLSHSLLVMLLQGKRPLRLKHVPTFARTLNLPEPERLYFQTLIELEEARSPEAARIARDRLFAMNPSATIDTREIDEFELISSWSHFAILGVCDLEQFDGSEAYIIASLRHRLPPNEIRSAIARLQSLGLLECGADGRYSATQTEVTTKNDLGREAVKKYHSEVSELAASSVKEQSVHEREFQSFALSIHSDDIPVAKEMIRQFRQAFFERFSRKKGTDVYNVNLQFFRLTERPAAKFQQPEDEGVELQPHLTSPGATSC